MSQWRYLEHLIHLLPSGLEGLVPTGQGSQVSWKLPVLLTEPVSWTTLQPSRQVHLPERPFLGTAFSGQQTHLSREMSNVWFPLHEVGWLNDEAGHSNPKTPTLTTENHKINLAVTGIAPKPKINFHAELIRIPYQKSKQRNTYVDFFFKLTRIP